MALLLLVSGCSLRDSPAPIPYPTNPETPVLWVEIKGGGQILPAAFTAANLPTFVLYGDGTWFSGVESVDPYVVDLGAQVKVRKITKPGIEAILAQAGQAGLLGPAKDYGTPLTTEAPPITTLRFNAAGEKVAHSVAAIFLTAPFSQFEQEPSWPTVERRLAAQAFYDRLFDLEGWLPAGSIGEETPATFEQFMVFYSPSSGDSGAIEWPEATLPPLSNPVGSEPGCAPINQEQLDLLIDLRGRNQTLALNLAATGGVQYYISVRPVLPGEKPCP